MAVGVSYSQGDKGLPSDPGTETGDPDIGARSAPSLRQAMAIPIAESQDTSPPGLWKEQMLIGNGLRPTRRPRKWDKLRIKYSTRTEKSEESIQMADGSLVGPLGVGGMLAELANISLADLPKPPGDPWPGPDKGDRILSQMLHVPASHQNMTEANDIPLWRYKKIYVFNGLPEGVPSGERKFENDRCPVRDCFLTDNFEEALLADVILFSGLMGKPVITKPRNQLWIMFFLESPIHTQELTPFHDLVNWTATYRRDSTIVTPYEKFVPYANNNNSLSPFVPARNYADGKTKKVAWFVSNCYTTNGRLLYARELAKHIDVDIFGDCGRMHCPRTSASVCFDMLKKDYKFYLSFENSNCRDYITEKFFTNALE